MIKNKTLEESFLTTKLIMILRNIQPDKTEAVTDALLAAGVSLFEITMNSPSALNEINNCKKKYDGKIYIGAGTVLNKKDAKAAGEAGAEFIVTPNTDRQVIEYCAANGLPCFPGAMTPTEIALAMDYGAKFIKIFPASSLGPKYIKELTGPFNRARFVAVGGINADNAKEFINAGCVGVGAGGGILNAELIKKERFDEITALTKKMLDALLLADFL